MGEEKVSEGQVSGWRAVLRFGVHSLMGTVMFCILALPALGLNLLVHWLEQKGFSPYVLAILTALEYIVLTLDAVLYLFLLVKSLYKAGKEMEL